MKRSENEDIDQPAVGVFPGCSLQSSAGTFMRSLERTMELLGCRCREVADWNCCGATSAHAMEHRLHLSLNLRNLALAEAQGFSEVLVPCAACFHRLAAANHQLTSDPRLLTHLNGETGLQYRGSLRVRNIMDFFVNTIGVERLFPRIETPLQGLRVVCYYGCLNTRLPRVKPTDSVEYPMAMDRIVQALGAEAADWSYKTECCGAGHFLTNENLSAKLVGKILNDAAAHAVHGIVVSCPMCHNNLQLKQDQIRKKYDIPKPLPVYFLTELMVKALLPSDRSGVKRSDK